MAEQLVGPGDLAVTTDYRDVLGELNRSLSRVYASEGRPSIPPEQLLSALLLQVFYGIRSERQLMEQRRIKYDLETTQRKIREAGLPEVLADRLAYGR